MRSYQSIRSNPLKEVIVFFAITIGLSYFIFWGPIALFQIPTINFVEKTMGPVWAIVLFMLGGFVPSLTAIALTGIREGKPGLNQLWRRLIQFRIGWRWYLAVIFIVLLGSTCQILLNNLLGGSFDFSLFLQQLPSFLPLIIIGPLSEELGWRGYAQTRLQTRWNPMVAGFVVGMVWALWHLPLFLMVGTSQHELNMPFMGFCFGLLAHSVIYAWLQNHTDNSIWTAVFFHWIFTYAMQVVATGVTRSPLYNWLEYTPYMVIAVVIAWIWDREMKTRVVSPRPLESQT